MDSGRMLALTLRAIAGRHEIRAFEGLEHNGEQALRAARALADGARPAAPPTHTVAAGIPPGEWRALRSGSDVLVTDLPGERAESAWRTLAAAAAETGWHPVLIGPLRDARAMTADGARFADPGLAHSWRYAGTPASALEAAAQRTLDDYLKQYGVELAEQPLAAPPPRAHPHPWPIARGQMGSDANTRLERARAGHHRRVYMLLIPTDAPWKAPAWLATHTAGEATPSNTALVLLARHLHRAYGAVVFGAGPAALSVRLPKPPTAEATAALHTLCRRLCPDIYHEVSAADFAAARAAGDDVYFWWD